MTRRQISARRLAFYLFLILVAGVLSPRIFDAAATNSTAIVAAKALAVGSPPLDDAKWVLSLGESVPCRTFWLKGKVSDAVGDKVGRDTAWANLIACAPDFIPILRQVVPDSSILAELAVKERPDNSQSWFWLAWIDAKDNPVESIRYYREGLRLEPRDGRRWKELGDLLAGGDPRGAMDAYLQACYNGDPGYNGCWRAGQVAEGQGSIQLAVQYYRLSKWAKALERADELERQLAKR